ncbi:MAG: hypothetical protein EA398_15485 [Deltaproteobacteria bacterium]|nr:MAG: hypothetical protein EA398_15485 [Deltaproteobacteria bacterium]
MCDNTMTPLLSGDGRDRALSGPVRLLLLSGLAVMLLYGCSESPGFDPVDPASGPGIRMAGQEPVSLSSLGPMWDAEPAALADAEPACGAACRSFCDAQGFTNPVNRALCPHTWGVGIETAPVRTSEACRRLAADLTGVLPSLSDIRRECVDERWDDVARGMIESENFVFVNQRRWADTLRYNVEVVNVERIYDADALVGRLHRGEVSYDTFAAAVSAHPVFTRRFATAEDRAEALFLMLLGRPPLGSERSDMARLLGVWSNGYVDHPELGMRVPDAYVRYRCVTDDGAIDPDSSGACTSVLWGYNPLILTPDARATRDRSGQMMWNGLLTAEEWHALQLPGRILARTSTFWEHVVDRTLLHYLGYPLGSMVPAVRSALVDHLLAHDADIRVLHYAIVTSHAYLQSTQTRDAEVPWAAGPLKQADAEVWIDSVAAHTGYRLSTCDHRISRPEDFLRVRSPFAWALVENSRWEIDGEGRLREDYRNLARNLGGCPENTVGGRFRVVSILTTSTQLNFVNRVCNPSMDDRVRGADAAALLPPEIAPNASVDPDMAEAIHEWQIRRFLGRSASDAEREDAREAGEQCRREVCRAEEFARPSCFAVLSSPEMMFY